MWGIARHPSVLLAIDPRYGLNYLASEGIRVFLMLGRVFLCVTGAEVLYADMGHFGARPIRLAWSILVFPSLVVNYAGQAELVVAGAPTADNLFYRLCPSALLIRLVILDGRHHHREPIHHHWRLFGDPTGHPVRLAPSPADHPNIRRGLRADLRRHGQLGSDDRNRPSRYCLPQIR